MIGKPSTFPPSAHTQDQSTINGLTDALAAKLTTPTGGTTGQVLTKTADSVAWSNAAGDMLKSEYDADDDGTVDNANLALFAQNVGTSPENSKSYSQVSSAVELMHEHSNMSVLNGIGVSSNQLTYNGSAVGGTPSWNNVTDKPDSFPPSAHTHAIADVTGLSDALEAAGTVKSVNGNNPNDSGAVTIPNATDTENGLMSAADKEKLDGLSDVAGTVTSVNGIEPDESGNVALNAKTVSSSESVNNITESGTYYVHASASGLPTDGAGGGAYMMEVIYDKTSGYVLQRITALYNANVQYMRAGRGTSSSWDEWRSLSDIISIGSIDPVSARMGGWFWTKFHSNLPLDTTITDEILFADFENKGSPRVQLAFNYTTGDIHMRRSTDAGSWIQMGSSGGRNARWAAGITGVSPNVRDVSAVVDVGKSYSSLVSAVATLSIKSANISNITTQIPAIYYDHHDYSTNSGLLSVYFNVINPPETSYSVNWAVYYQ